MFQNHELIAQSPNLHKFALRLTRNANDAEDLMQATLLRAIEKKDYFQQDTNLFGWTSKIMFNLFISNYRQKKFETQYDPEPYIQQVSIGPSQEASVDLVTVSKGMERLSPEHREILILVCLRGLRYEEASEVLQVPVGTIRSRLSRARQNLQEILTSSSDLTRPSIPAYQAAAALQAQSLSSVRN